MRNILETEANPPVLNQYFQSRFIFFTQSYLYPVNESYNIIIQINLLDLVLLLIFLTFWVIGKQTLVWFKETLLAIETMNAYSNLVTSSS